MKKMTMNVYDDYIIPASAVPRLSKSNNRKTIIFLVIQYPPRFCYDICIVLDRAHCSLSGLQSSSPHMIVGGKYISPDVPKDDLLASYLIRYLSTAGPHSGLGFVNLLIRCKRKWMNQKSLYTTHLLLIKLVSLCISKYEPMFLCFFIFKYYV